MTFSYSVSALFNCKLYVGKGCLFTIYKYNGQHDEALTADRTSRHVCKTKKSIIIQLVATTNQNTGSTVSELLLRSLA